MIKDPTLFKSLNSVLLLDWLPLLPLKLRQFGSFLDFWYVSNSVKNFDGIMDGFDFLLKDFSFSSNKDSTIFSYIFNNSSYIYLLNKRVFMLNVLRYCFLSNFISDKFTLLFYFIWFIKVVCFFWFSLLFVFSLKVFFCCFFISLFLVFVFSFFF